jgi:hypothetical protein
MADVQTSEVDSKLEPVIILQWNCECGYNFKGLTASTKTVFVENQKCERGGRLNINNSYFLRYWVIPWPIALTLMELSAVIYCLTTGWTTGRSGLDSRRGQRIFHLSSVSGPALGPTQPPVQWVPGVLSPGVKARPGRDADHSPPSSAEV